MIELEPAEQGMFGSARWVLAEGLTVSMNVEEGQPRYLYGSLHYPIAQVNAQPIVEMKLRLNNIELHMDSAPDFHKVIEPMTPMTVKKLRQISLED